MQRCSLGFVILVMSCGKGTEQKPPAPEGSGAGSAVTPAKAPPRTLQLSEVLVAPGTPFELHDLKILKVSIAKDGTLTENTGSLVLRVTVKPTGTVAAGARLSIATTCRTHDTNLAFDEDRDTRRQDIRDAVANHGGEVEAIYHADPFHDPPQPCELTVRYRAATTAPPVTSAVACYRDDALTIGACPDGTFPPPAADVGEISISPTATMDSKPGSAVIHGMFTLGKALAAGETLGSTWRCSDGTKVFATKPGSDSVVFWTPGAMAEGTSADGSLTTFFQGTGGAATRCEVTVVARTAEATDRTLGAFCIDKAGTVARGACAPKL